MSDILVRLAAPFKPNEVDWRIGATNKEKTSGMALVYIDSRAVMHRLDGVCGHLWQCEYVPMPNGTYCCRIGIKVGDEWIWRSNGAINYPDSDKGDAKEMAAKGSYSDAFKRAGVLWGIGQYLYDTDSPWVDIVAKGNSHVFAPGVRAKLDQMLMRGAAKQPEAKPEALTQSPPVNTGNSSDPKVRAAAWYEGAIKQVRGAKSMKDLDEWLANTAKESAYLMKIDINLSNKLQDAVATRTDVLRNLLAAM